MGNRRLSERAVRETLLLEMHHGQLVLSCLCLTVTMLVTALEVTRITLKIVFRCDATD